MTPAPKKPALKNPIATKPASRSMIIKNRRLKMSPGGIITLPVSARKALHMEKGEGGHVTVAVAKGSVILAPAAKTGGFRVSPKGQLELRGDARAILATGIGRHYWMELNDAASSVKLNPFE